jgi:hypothetical protein
MKFEGVSASDQKLWEDYVSAYQALVSATGNFRLNSASQVEILKEALDSGHRSAALYFLETFSPDELKQVFKELVALAGLSHSAVASATTLILKLPKEWLLEHIEAAAEPLLSGNYTDVYDIYRMLLYLYDEIDPELTQRLAKRAISQEDPDIQEQGYDYLSDETGL